MLSKERVIKALRGLGLSSGDAQVYIFLATTGHQEIREITSALNFSEKKVHSSLKNLQCMSIIKASIEYPLTFEALPFEEVVNLIIEVKKEQAKTLKATREELLVTWRSITEKDKEKS